MIWKLLQPLTDDQVLNRNDTRLTPTPRITRKLAPGQCINLKVNPAINSNVQARIDTKRSAPCFSLLRYIPDTVAERNEPAIAAKDE